MIIAVSLAGTSAFAGNASLPDSLITDDHVYEYTFSDFDKAQRIMHELRKRKTLPDFKLDATEGDLYFNTGHYYQALKFYRRALENDSVRLDDHRLMEQIHRLISCYDCLHNETKKAQYVDMLMKKAEQCGNEEMQSVAMFNMGKMLYYQGNKDKGYDYMQRAADLMEQTDYKYKYDNLRYNYNTLLTFQELDRRSEEALRSLEALQRVVTEETGNETPMEGLGEKEKKAMYAHYAVVLNRLGRTREAEESYKQFLAVAPEYDRDNYLIMPYLFDRRMYDEVIRMNSARERILSSQGDTVTYHMTTIKKSLGRAYEEKGDYRTASRYFRELAVLRDSIKNREQKSSTLELATLYETHEKEAQLTQQAAKLRENRMILLFAVCIIGLLGVLMWRIIRHARTIRIKNKSMSARIDDLLNYKDELYRRKDENLILTERLKTAEDELQKWKSAVNVLSMEKEAQSDTVSTDTTTADVEQPDADTSEDNPNNETIPNGQSLFDRAEREIISRKLFLQPDFSRADLMKLVRIPKNKFALLFKQYAGIGFSQYINNLRMDYAARMLKEHPDYAIDAIAKECGIPNKATFYRLFLEQFGMTPSEYRSGNKHAENE